MDKNKSDTSTLMKRKASLTIVGFGTALKMPEKSVPLSTRHTMKASSSVKKFLYLTPAKGKQRLSSVSRKSEPASFSTARASDPNLSVS